MNPVAWPYRVLAILALGVALFGFGWVKGAEHVQARCDAHLRQQEMQVAEARARQAEVAVKVVTRYVDRVRVVREKGNQRQAAGAAYRPLRGRLQHQLPAV